MKYNWQTWCSWGCSTNTFIMDSLIQWVILFLKISRMSSLQNQNTQGAEIWENVHLPPRIPCPMLPCHVSRVTCQNYDWNSEIAQQGQWRQYWWTMQVCQMKEWLEIRPDVQALYHVFCFWWLKWPCKAHRTALHLFCGSEEPANRSLSA